MWINIYQWQSMGNPWWRLTFGSPISQQAGDVLPNSAGLRNLQDMEKPWKNPLECAEVSFSTSRFMGSTRATQIHHWFMPIWLVVSTNPPKNDGVRQIGSSSQLLGKMTFMFQTTNQPCFETVSWRQLVTSPLSQVKSNPYFAWFRWSRLSSHQKKSLKIYWRMFFLGYHVVKLTS